MDLKFFSRSVNIVGEITGGAIFFIDQSQLFDAKITSKGKMPLTAKQPLPKKRMVSYAVFDKKSKSVTKKTYEDQTFNANICFVCKLHILCCMQPTILCIHVKQLHFLVRSNFKNGNLKKITALQKLCIPV